MVQTIKKILPLVCLAAATSGCAYKDLLETEQYEKSVYIVGANQSNNEGLYIVNLPFKAAADEQAETFISVATGGTKYVDRNVEVNIAEAGPEAVDAFNKMYLYKSTDIRYQMLNSSLYTIPSKNVTVKSGEIYGNMQLKVNTQALHTDSLYAMTFKIATVSDPSYISIRQTDTVLMLSFNLVNDFSGVYQEAGKAYKYNFIGTPDTSTISATRNLKALSHNKVRLIHLANTETIANATVSGIILTINGDKTLSVAPYGTLALTDGGGTYDVAKGTFNLWYNYTDAGVARQFKGTLTKSGS